MQNKVPSSNQTPDCQCRESCTWLWRSAAYLMEYSRSILTECMHVFVIDAFVVCKYSHSIFFPHHHIYFTWFCSRPGGDKIYNIFDNQLPAALKRLQFDKHLAMENVRKLITEADGYQPHLIAPEQGYRRLIETALITIKGPAEAAVEAVYISSFRIVFSLCCFLCSSNDLLGILLSLHPKNVIKS